MARTINPKWTAMAREKLANGGAFTYMTSHKMVIQEAIMIATELGRAYKLISNGAGVTTFTTDTDTCPCCKRKL